MLSPEQKSRHRQKIAGWAKHTNSQLPLREKKLKIWNYILHAEVEAGTRFLVTDPEGHLFIVLGYTREILSLSKASGNGKIAAYLCAMYGLSEREEITRFTADNLRAYGIIEGTKVELRRFASYVIPEQTTYLSGYDGSMWKIDGKDVINVPTGEDEVFFADDDGGKPVVPDIRPHGLLLDRLTNLNYGSGLSGITAEQQRMALTIWLFALAFPDLMPTKPLLILEGSQGSGKTASIILTQIALMGRKKPISVNRTKEDSFGILLLRSPIALFDNTDSYIDWLPDAVCTYTTSGVFPRRKLYSDDDEIVIKPHAFIAVASKNPVSFRREDVVDRTIVIRLDRRPGFKRMGKLEEEVLNERSILFGEYLHYVNRLVAEIRSGALDEADTESHRMADFAAFGRLVGRVVGWSVEDVANLMTALQNERDAFTAEEDPLIELLHNWISYRARGGTNIGREMSINGLFSELETIAQAQGTERSYYKSPRQLAQKIRSQHVLRDFDVEIGTNGNQRTYKIYRKTDPRLTIIDGGSDEAEA